MLEYQQGFKRENITGKCQNKLCREKWRTNIIGQRKTNVTENWKDTHYSER